MNNTTRELFLKPVLEAMQHAEEMGGPEGAEYEELMGAIASEANKRRQAFLENQSAGISTSQPYHIRRASAGRGNKQLGRG